MYQFEGTNPIIYSDYPDADVIRVNDTYYMVSTTMHFMPGCVILKSYDLIHWATCSYCYDRLDSTPGQQLKDGKGIYGKGMWAASIRYHEGMFYICFVANDTGKTYIFRSENIEGPWRKNVIEGSFFHDSSILFDDDGRVYVAYGNRNIYITELNEDLTAVKEGGLHRLAVTDENKVWLGYEGSHLYKINGKYYIFFIHWPENSMRTEACFVADSIDGEFKGSDVLCSDLDDMHSGTAQGGIVDTPDGDWYGIVFQDHGAVGRIPVLVPVTWKDGFPVFGENGVTPKKVTVSLKDSEKAERFLAEYTPEEALYASDSFDYAPDRDGAVRLKKVWQWNHEPDDALWSVTEKPGKLSLTGGKLSPNLVQAVNTLTQRTYGKHCAAEVTVDAGEINEGDYAGLCALQGSYGFIAVTKKNGKFCLTVMKKKETERRPGMGSFDAEPGQVVAEIEGASRVTFRMECDFSKDKDTVRFLYTTKTGNIMPEDFVRLGDEKKMFFSLDHFTGCRFGLFYFPTMTTGGKAYFENFEYFVLD